MKHIIIEDKKEKKEKEEEKKEENLHTSRVLILAGIYTRCIAPDKLHTVLEARC